MNSSLLLQQCPACLVRVILIIFVMGCRWPYWMSGIILSLTKIWAYYVSSHTEKLCYNETVFLWMTIYIYIYIYIYMLSVIWKSDLTDKMKRSFFQAAVVSILLYGFTTWTLTKYMEKKLDGNYTRMLRAILNKPWRQHPTKHQMYGHLPPITKT